MTKAQHFVDTATVQFLGVSSVAAEHCDTVVHYIPTHHYHMTDCVLSLVYYDGLLTADIMIVLSLFSQFPSVSSA